MPLPTISISEPSNEDRFVIDASKPVAGELYTDGASLFAVHVTSATEARLTLAMLHDQDASTDHAFEKLPFHITVFAVTSSSERAQAQTFVAAVEGAFGVVLAEKPFINKKFKDLLLEEGRSPPLPPSESQKEAARELTDRNLRSLAISIRTAGGILTRDLPKQLAPEVKDLADALRERLEQHGLASSEFVVVCRKTQASIATIPSKDALASLSKIGMRCSCGRPIAEEDVQKALAVTELCRGLLDGSKWLTLLLLQELQSIGVSLSETLIEQQFGGDEIDCLAVISGELVLFELKDKDFNLGNAYSFGAKVGFIQPDHSIILTTQRVGSDAREHFQRAKVGRKAQQTPWETVTSSTSNIRYIEGIDRLTAEIRDLASFIYSGDARQLLGQVLSHGTLKPDHLLTWFNNKSVS